MSCWLSVAFPVLFCWCWLVFWKGGSVMMVVADEMENFPLDTLDKDMLDVGVGAESNDYNHNTSEFPVDLDDIDNEKSKKPAPTDNRIGAFNKIMMTAMKEPAAKQRLAQVLPIIRAMSPTQRLTLATLVLNQLTSSSSNSLHLEQLANKSSELMLPISVDIAAMLQDLKKNAESGRSNALGTYYYNPLSAGYRVNGASNSPRPLLYDVRRRFQTISNNRKKLDDIVPPEMMPPPFVPSANVSYASFNKMPLSNDRHHQVSHNEIIKEGINDYDNESTTTGEDSGEHLGNGNTDVDHDNTDDHIEQCDINDNNICDEAHSYPSKNIVTSIKNLEQKHMFRALVEDFRNDASDENPEIQRRLGSLTTSSLDDALHLCPSKIKYARPKKAKSTNGSWKFVVNTDHYTQTVRIEICQNADKSCSSYFNGNIKSQCVQVYNYHRLLTWDEKAGLSLDLFKIPTCCSCQIQQVVPFAQAAKNSNKPNVESQENTNTIVDVDETNVILQTPFVKPKLKNKLNLAPLPPYTTLKRESVVAASPPSLPSLSLSPTFGAGTKMKRPPVILPLQHSDGGITRYSAAATDNAIRRTNGKTNILKGVFVPGKGPVTEYATEPESASSQPRRVNYNYHPIIDFFRSTPAEANDRADTADVFDDWLPLTEGPRMIKNR